MALGQKQVFTGYGGLATDGESVPLCGLAWCSLAGEALLLEKGCGGREGRKHRSQRHQLAARPNLPLDSRRRLPGSCVLFLNAESSEELWQEWRRPFSKRPHFLNSPSTGTCVDNGMNPSGSQVTKA